MKAILGSLQNLLTVSVSPRGFPGLLEILGAWPAEADPPFQGPPFNLIASKNQNLGKPTSWGHNPIVELSGVRHIISI